MPACGDGSSAAPWRAAPGSARASGPGPSAGTSSSRPPETTRDRNDRGITRSYRAPRTTERGHEDRVLARGVRREELDDLLVVERESAGAEALAVRGEIG